MDKTKSKGVSKPVKQEKQILHQPQGHKDKPIFKVEENDFPSLSEVQEKRAERNPSTSDISLFSYSSKLKTLPTEGSLQNTKSENVQRAERVPKNESTLHKTGSSRYVAKSVQVNNQSFTKQSSTVPSTNKKDTDCQVNSNFFGVKSKKPEYFNKHTHIDQSHGQKAVYDNRPTKSVHAESSTFENMRYSPQKSHSSITCTNIQKPVTSKSLSTEKKTYAGYSSAARSERFYHKENNKPNTNVVYKRLDEANRYFRSNAGTDINSRLPHMNVIQGNGSGNTSNKTRITNSTGIQRAYNSAKPENNLGLQQPLNAQPSTAVTGETKKKKKRKSKLKRQAALQTGKIFVLTPEAHSKIVNQSNNVSVQKNPNILTNINDNEEYPELGAADPKPAKESHFPEANVHTKVENPTDLVTLQSETDSRKIIKLPQESSVNNDVKDSTKSEEKINNPVEKPESEKTTIHSSNRITLSLFDMLATAKPRKKEAEKKVELVDGNTGKSFKKELIKKNISQAVNPLASSKAATKRGKEREKPKVKRPSRMRKLILMERQLRKENTALKKHESEDENEEKPDEILPDICISKDNLDTCVEIIENYLVNSKNSDEAFDIYVNLNNMISEHLLDSDSNALSLKSLENTSEKSSSENEMKKQINGSVKNPTVDIDNNANKCSSTSSSIMNVKEDLFLNLPSSLIDKEENFVDDSVDIKTVENNSEIDYSNIKVPTNKLLDLQNKKGSSCCIDENLKLKDADCLTNNLTDQTQVSKQKVIEGNVNTTAGNFASANIEFKSGKRCDLFETENSVQNFDSSENIEVKNSINSFSEEERLRATKLMLHSRKFRHYCNHFISKEIDQAIFSLIDDLARFQDRMYQKDPVKAKIRRRLVYGIKEIKKHMKLKKVKGIIIATDIEDIKIEGGLNDSIRELISLAEAYQIPCIFSHWRFNLGKVCRKSVPVSCVGIFNYEGSEKNFKKVIELQDDSKHDYLAVTTKLARELTNDQVHKLFEAEKESALFLREVSQKILREMVYFTPEGYRNSDTSKGSGVVSTQGSDDTSLFMCEKSVSLIEEYSEGLEKSHKDESLLQKNQTDVNTILVKYKVVKEC